MFNRIENFDEIVANASAKLLEEQNDGLPVEDFFTQIEREADEQLSLARFGGVDGLKAVLADIESEGFHEFDLDRLVKEANRKD